LHENPNKQKPPAFPPFYIAFALVRGYPVLARCGPAAA